MYYFSWLSGKILERHTVSYLGTERLREYLFKGFPMTMIWSKEGGGYFEKVLWNRFFRGIFPGPIRGKRFLSAKRVFGGIFAVYHRFLVFFGTPGRGGNFSPPEFLFSNRGCPPFNFPWGGAHRGAHQSRGNFFFSGENASHGPFWGRTPF